MSPVTRFALWFVAAGLLTACDGGDDGDSDEPPPNPVAGQAIYDEKCVSCHTLGGGVRTGPDLRGVTQRRQREWLVRWLTDTAAMEKNDPIGRQLFKEYKSIPMAQPTLNEAQIRDVLAFIEQESARPPRPPTKQ